MFLTIINHANPSPDFCTSPLVFFSAGYGFLGSSRNSAAVISSVPVRLLFLFRLGLRHTLHIGTGASVNSVQYDNSCCEEGEHWFRYGRGLLALVDCHSGILKDLHILPGNFLGRKPGMVAVCEIWLVVEVN